MVGRKFRHGSPNWLTSVRTGARETVIRSAGSSRIRVGAGRLAALSRLTPRFPAQLSSGPYTGEILPNLRSRKDQSIRSSNGLFDGGGVEIDVAHHTGLLVGVYISVCTRNCHAQVAILVRHGCGCEGVIIDQPVRAHVGVGRSFFVERSPCAGWRVAVEGTGEWRAIGRQLPGFDVPSRFEWAFGRSDVGHHVTAPGGARLPRLTRVQFQQRVDLRDALLKRLRSGAPSGQSASKSLADAVCALRHTAHHEAAHATTYALLGLRFRKVSIVGRPSWGYDGRVSIASLRETEAKKDERVMAVKGARTPEWRDMRHKWLTGVVAAWTAQRRSLSDVAQEKEYGADYRLAADLARLINEYDHSGVPGIVGESETHVRLLLAEHARAYGAVARSLFDRLTLSESEVLAICSANTHPYSACSICGYWRGMAAAVWRQTGWRKWRTFDGAVVLLAARLTREGYRGIRHSIGKR